MKLFLEATRTRSFLLLQFIVDLISLYFVQNVHYIIK